MSAPVRVGRGHRRAGGDLEDGYDALVGDLDFGDESLDGGLAFAGRAAGHDRGEVLADPGDGGGRRGRGWGGEVDFEFGVARVEVSQTLAEFADARPGGGVVHGAVFEGGVVAADGCLGGGDLMGGRAEFDASVVAGGVALGVSAFDHGGQDGFGGGVEVV
ncbi:hypothetical protein ACLQ2S_15325 [Micromonospora sp. DT48]|uniref:hypothetical protein n=1 Tax=Micromonospora sp. DT48 TaxID=3393429 RepID=UPI003CF4AE0F